MRQYIYSAMTAINIGPKDDEAAKGFRFCCALNPALSKAGRTLPDYIEQRTLPVIEIKQPPFEDLYKIVETSLKPAPDFLEAFEEWYHEEEDRDVSVRQVISLMNYAINYEKHVGGRKLSVLKKVSSYVFGQL